MSKRELIDALHELDQLGIVVQVEDDEHLLEALDEIGVEDD